MQVSILIKQSNAAVGKEKRYGPQVNGNEGRAWSSERQSV